MHRCLHRLRVERDLLFVVAHGERRLDFANGDGESDASGSKSLKSKAYGAMQTRIKDAKSKKELNRVKAKAARPAKSSTNTTKRVKNSSAGGSQGSVEKNDEKGRSLTH